MDDNSAFGVQMFRSTRLTISAAILAAAMAAGASPASSGDRHHHAVGVTVYHVDIPWYHQPPWIGTGPGHYYSHYPDHVPSYPEPRTGTPVPIFRTDHPVGPTVVLHHRGVLAIHVEWCAARYRSYDVGTNSYQPYHGPRRSCRSPYR